MAVTSVECSKDNLALASRHQVSVTAFWEGKNSILGWVSKG